MLRTVRLKKDAAKLAEQVGADIGFLRRNEQDVRTDHGEVEVTSREFHQLEYYDLIEPDSPALVTPAADQKEADKAAAQEAKDADARAQDSRKGLGLPESAKKK